MEERIKVLVVDDASFMRNAITDILEADAGIEVVGSARNGLEGLEKIKSLRPDVITLDIDMPVMDGLTTIKHIMIESPVPIVVLSSLFGDGAVTFEALRLGVVDFVPKPSGAISEDISTARTRIIDRTKIATAVNIENIRRVRVCDGGGQQSVMDIYRYRSLDYLLTMGTTLSGPNTVIRMLCNLPPTLPAAVVVLQEISPKILDAFVEKFDQHVSWKVEVAREGAPLEQGTCYINSTESMMGVGTNADGNPCLVQNRNGQQPLNHLFSTAAEVFQTNAIGLLLTGIGEDGADGLGKIRANSGIAIAQDVDTCVYPNLTHNAIARKAVDIVADEVELPKTITSIIKV